jgi:hypothetical protein
MLGGGADEKEFFRYHDAIINIMVGSFGVAHFYLQFFEIKTTTLL